MTRCAKRAKSVCRSQRSTQCSPSANTNWYSATLSENAGANFECSVTTRIDPSEAPTSMLGWGEARDHVRDHGHSSEIVGHALARALGKTTRNARVQQQPALP
eukprot:CAMPEP_0184214474 /NCGR_PEP_ID=MMETSP0976-20121227/14673_1 /TAXON_ID=483370 /ORGANISM="non described non described, Strain CCMP2097" /LENGTH=102 /DNA_ID=CAMNT_0026519229 /DNA_START=306 /DNA_END=614 /DNA_ORIENTATION=-